MDSLDALAAKRYFNNRLELHGDNVNTLDWGSEYSQNKRFEILTSFGIKHNYDILDLGTGLGHFYRYLIKRGFYGKFTGVDIVENFIDHCKNTYPEAEFEKSSISEYLTKTRLFDCIFASGIFYLLNRDEAELRISWTINEMFKKSRNFCATNSLCLTSNQEPKENSEYRISPDNLENIVSSITTNYKIVEDYLEGDISVALFK